MTFSYIECWKIDSKEEFTKHLKSIRNSAFYQCQWLAYIEFPSSLINIGDDAFNKCKSLAEIAIPSSVSYYGEFSFHKCKSLKKVKILSPQISIKRGTFKDCSSLEQIEIPLYTTTIGEFLLQLLQSEAALSEAAYYSRKWPFLLPWRNWKGRYFVVT